MLATADTCGEDSSTTEQMGDISRSQTSSGSCGKERCGSLPGKNTDEGIRLRPDTFVCCAEGKKRRRRLRSSALLEEEADRVVVYLLANPDDVRGEAATNLKRWRESGGEVLVVRSVADWKRKGLVVDCLLGCGRAAGVAGTGIRGGATGVVAQAIEDINRLSRMRQQRSPAGFRCRYAVRIAFKTAEKRKVRWCARI